MVATWQPAAPAAYYKSHTTYYLGGVEPRGSWCAPAGDFGLVDGADVDDETFERLYSGVGKDGKSLVSTRRGRPADRRPATDKTFSAPRSVSLVWAFGPHDVQQDIEAAQDRAVRAALAVLEREATFARRGHNGERIERVALSAALFRHGESRPAEHDDGRKFGDPNLHTHAVCLNISTRSDGSVGALHSIEQRNFKMTAGAVYHAALAAELQTLGFAIDRIAYNGVFEIHGVDDDLIAYFSARRKEIKTELEKLGAGDSDSSALAAAVARSTRSAKDRDVSKNREEIWKDAARARGVDVENFADGLFNVDALDREAGEKLFAERVSELPRTLTEHQSIIDRSELLRAVACALVGTSLPAARVDVEVERLLAEGAVVEIGVDRTGRPRYSTPEIVRIEREAVALAGRLAEVRRFGIDADTARAFCQMEGLSVEQTAAAVAATSPGALGMIAGVAGSGKTTTLRAVEAAYRSAGHRVFGAAIAWRMANVLRDDLAIPSRSIASWIETLKHGGEFLARGDVLIVDEAGLLGSRDTHALLRHVAEVGAKILLVGEERQLSPINAGSGWKLCARAVEAARVETIVRQREEWARDAILAFRDGRAAEALDAFAERGKVLEMGGAKAAIDAVVAAWREAREREESRAPLIIARTNAAVAAISRSVREVLRDEGKIVGADVDIAAVTPSGQSTEITLARGDRIRFLSRNDKLGVINGTTATVVGVRDNRAALAANSRSVEIEAEIEGRRVTFAPEDVADGKGRARLAWAYGATTSQSQGATVSSAIVLVDAGYDRRQIYVAASRARDDTLFVIDAAAIDRRLVADLPTDKQCGEAAFLSEDRRAWLSARLALTKDKETTLDAIQSATAPACKKDGREKGQSEAQDRNRNRSREQSLG